MNKAKSNKGITLIALIITIVVLLVLAVVAIGAVTGEDGIIKRAQQTKFLSDVGKYKEELEEYKTNFEIEYQLNNRKPIKVGEEEIDRTADINAKDSEKIKIFIKSFAERYEGKLFIEAGELVYQDSGNDIEERKWAESLGLIIKTEGAIITLKTEGLGTISSELMQDGKISVKKGQEITITAVTGSVGEGEGKVESSFGGWYSNGAQVCPTTTYTFTVTGNETLIAIFETDATIIYYLDGEEEKILLDKTVDLSTYINSGIDKSKITKVEFGTKCTSMPSYAFAYCTILENVKIPSNVDLISRTAPFESSTNLKEVTIGEIGSPITEINNVTFYKCEQQDLIIKIYIESGKISLPNEPWGATNATVEYYDATTGELVNIILGQRYQGKTEINFTEIPNADKITKIKAGAFLGCTNLALTTLPKNVTYIGKQAFANCSNITITQIPEKCEEIGESAFDGCNEITEITTSKNKTLKLGTYAFARCKKLKTVKMPNVDLSIPIATFESSTNIKEITIGDIGNTISAIKETTFNKCEQQDFTIKIYIESGKTRLLNEPWRATNATIEYYDTTTEELVNMSLGQRYKGNTEINFTKIPNADKITKIKDGAFSGCTNLALTSLPTNVTYIGASAFNGCTNLAITQIPEKCEEIGNYAFANCTGITEITTSKNKTIKLGAYAFANCTNLGTVKMPNVNLSGSRIASFERCTKLTEITIGDIGIPITIIDSVLFNACKQDNLKIIVYVKKGTTSLLNEPWGATNATIEYLDATNN